MEIRILIVEDEIIIARFIEQQIAAAFPYITEIALTAQEAREAMKRLQPHLLLCDIHLGEETTGIELISELREQASFEVIYITSYNAHSIIEKAAATFPANYLIKPIDEAQLFAGMQLVMARIQEKLLAGGAKTEPFNVFNPTELRILQLIREQKTTKEIAATLHLSPYTIKNHRHKMCRKLGLNDKNNALLRWALENNHESY
jgi:DNA-binding NarL/FixJ family response regulator